MATYRLKIRTSTSARPFAYISDPFELEPEEAAAQLEGLYDLRKLSAVHFLVDGELVVVNPRHIVAIHRVELEEAQ